MRTDITQSDDSSNLKCIYSKHDQEESREESSNFIDSGRSRVVMLIILENNTMWDGVILESINIKAKYPNKDKKECNTPPSREITIEDKISFDRFARIWEDSN